jgi:hypothetical protein
MTKNLTNDNYYENNDYMSASQFKDFYKCEAYGLAKYKKEWIDESSNAFLIGGYVDAYFSNELEKFKFEHSELFNRDGSLKATYKIAEEVIKRIEQDEYMMQLLSGKTQLVQTGTINGVPFKIKMDSVLEDTIVDQKIMKDTKDVWADGYKSFWEVYGYDIQLAIYQYIHAQNEGLMKTCKLAVATKESSPELAVYRFSQKTLDNALQIVKDLAPRYHDIKLGLINPVGCGKCAYCRSKMKLNENMEREI